MESNSSTPHWEAPKFSFSMPKQAEEWKVFYIRTVNILEALNINTEEEDSTKKGWKQLKIIESKDRQTL